MNSSITGAELILRSLEEEYSSYLSPIIDISKDTSGSRDFIEMDFNALHFDKIPYLWNIDKKEKGAFSVDTILFDSTKQILYLVEFKSSWPQKKTAQELRFKCYESLGKLLKYWTLILKKDRKEFFDIAINYCVITRPKSNQDINKASFLDALDFSGNFFKLKFLDGTFVDETRIILDKEQIFKFLSRVTGVTEMSYHRTDGTVDRYAK